MTPKSGEFAGEDVNIWEVYHTRCVQGVDSEA